MEGAQLGPYRVLGELGSGGMGKVYLAEVSGKVPGLDHACRVALKIIHPHLLETPGFFKRFLREAEIGQSVEQDNVVRCLDCDAVLLEGIQQNFLVMEYVEGQTLRGLLDELGTVPEELCRHIGREIAKGLAAIHEAGVIHRDLKPENVLITADHVVKVMDLGVARLQDELVRLSQTGAFVGSLEYAAPEQFGSDSKNVDARSDLHALGVMLYELATGHHPYRADDASATLKNVLDGKIRRVGEVNPQLSPFFEEVVHTLAAREPDGRFASASALLEALSGGERSAWWKARARELRVKTRRPLRRIRVPRETALYGRDDGLARLRALYRKVKGGDGQVFLIEGEAGIGKTRLVDEFVGRLRQEGEDVSFLFGSYPPGGAATAAGAFIEAYREQFGVSGLEDALQDYLSPTPVLIPAFAAILKGETTPTGAEHLTKDSLQTVFVHATRALASERTTIVLIDDLHFAPADGLALFSSLAMAVPGHRILLLGTMRPGVSEDWTAGVTRHDHAEHRSLGRLGPKDLTSLLEEAFRSERLAEELAFRIAQKSDGNPFFTFEIIRGLREGEFLAQRGDGTWVTTRAIRDIEVPSSVHDLVNARIAGLSEEERDLLDVAACSGFEFEPGLVAEAAGLSRIPALKRFGQIERRHRLVRGLGRKCVFDHHQVQEALYGSLLPELREEYHVAIARAREVRERGAGRGPKAIEGVVSVDICEHFLKGAKGERALPYLEAALRHLEACFRNDQAIALADRALDVPGLLGGKERFRVLMRKYDRLDLLGRREAQEAVLADARAHAEGACGRDCLAVLERKTRGLLWFLGRYEEARAHGKRDLALSREIGDRHGEALATMNLAGVALNEGRLDEARASLEESAALARETEDRQLEASATGSLGHVLYAMGRYGDAQTHHERHLALARADGDKRGEGWAHGNLGILFVSLGRYEEGREHHERALATARETGDRRGEGIALGNLGILFSGIGHLADAKEHYERYLSIACEVGGRDLEANALLGLGSVWLSLGQMRRARDAIQAALATCREIGAGRWEGYALSDLAAVASEEEDDSAALLLAVEALAVHRTSGDEHGVANSLSQLAEFRWRAGDGEGAREALVEAVDLLHAQKRMEALASAQLLLACLPGGGREAAELVRERLGKSADTILSRHYLWKATNDLVHLTQAKRLLDDLVERAPEEYRESMLTNVRLHREVLDAWSEHAGKAE